MNRALTILVILLAGCSSHPWVATAVEKPIRVVSSVFPITLIVRELGGARVAAETLVPPGASPHVFEPVPSDIAKLQNARYFIEVGDGLDSWADKLLGAASPTLEVVTLLKTPGLNPVKALHGEHADQKHAEEAGVDPHFWLDPIRLRDVVSPALTERLIQADPAGKLYYQERAQDFRRKLTALDNEIRQELSKARIRKYVAFHNAWRYFAERYGLKEVAVVQEFAGEEPTPREVAKLVLGARDAGIPKILVEPQLSPRIAETIASEFGAGTVVVDPLGDPSDPARSTYEGLMLFNARAFGQALQGQRN